jgi:hypothetical protein
MRVCRLISSAVFTAGSLVAFGATTALADTFNLSYLGPGVQTPAVTNFYETFDSGFTGTTNFNGSPITGTYSGTYQIENADQYGGAGGAGQYIATGTGSSSVATYTLTLSAGVDYLGMWFSALDQGNNLYFYNNNTLVFTFSPSDYAQLVGACPTGAPEPNFCGNPNGNFNDQDANEQFGYLNFFDTNGTFNKIVFTEDPDTGNFESDNHAVANIDTTPGGTSLTPTAVPEPSTFVLGLTGLAGLAGTCRQRLAARFRKSV